MVLLVAAMTAEFLQENSSILTVTVRAHSRKGNRTCTCCLYRTTVIDIDSSVSVGGSIVAPGPVKAMFPDPVVWTIPVSIPTPSKLRPVVGEVPR